MSGGITDPFGAKAAASKLPTVDDVLGPDKPPSVDDVLGPRPGWGFKGSVASGPGWDEFVKQSPIGRVLNAFGQGAAQGWGTSDLGMSPELEKGLQDAGILPDVKKGQAGPIRAINEAIIRPLAIGVDALARGGQALFSGGQAAMAQAGEEVGAPQLGRELAAMPEAFMGMPGFAGIPSLEDVQAYKAGGSDAEYFGTKEPAALTPEEQVKADVKQTQEAAKQPGYSPEALGLPASSAAPIQPYSVTPRLPNIDEAARSIAPDTFQEYDALAVQRDGLWDQLEISRRQLEVEAAAQAPNTARIQSIQAKLDAAPPRRLRLRYEDQLASLQQEHDAWFDGDQYAMLTRDTPEMQDMRQRLMAADYRMRDLAPQVTQAYRQARDMFPETQEEAPVSEAPLEGIEKKAGSLAEPEAQETQPPAEAQVTKPPSVESPPEVSRETLPGGPQQPGEPGRAAVVPAPEVGAEAPRGPSIAEDVSRNLVGAGRPQEEADAAGALIQAHYEARAQRFGGAKGSADELYRAEAPEIRGAEAGGRKGLAAGKAIIKDGRTTITLFKRADASTFIHETGHNWLEELLSDARDERAPQELRDSAAKVRDWLGAKEGERITTRQHEKFARSFERYMMEGVAPSRALDRVFQQFRGWLTKIYQTVKNIGAPISDDIRDVFDRLLTTQPERAAVVPEAKAEVPREVPLQETSANGSEAFAGSEFRRLSAVTGDLASIHEADAAETTSAEAAVAADQVREEWEPYVPRGRAAEEADGGTGGGASLQPPGAGGSTGVGGAGRVPEPTTVGRGGNNAAAEGASAPTEPNQPFAGPEPTYLDKAGNIRLELLTDDMAARQALREIAQRNGQFMDARRGVVSDAQVIDLADQINAGPSEINVAKLRQMSVEDDVPMAARILAGRKLLLQAEQGVRTAAAAGDPMAFIDAADRLNMIQETVSGITAEWGRAGRAFRQMQTETAGAQDLAAVVQGATGRTLFQIQQQMQQVLGLGTPAQVAQLARNMPQPTWGDMAQEYWVNAILSNPATHTTYAAGNELLALAKMFPERAVAAALGALHGGERVYFGETAAGAVGHITGWTRGVVAAGQAAKLGMTKLMPGETLGKLAGAAQGSFFAGQRSIPGALGTVVRIPSERMIAPIHTLFRTIGYEQELATLAYRQAASEGLAGDAFTRRFADLRSNPTSELMEAARTQANEAALMGPSGPFMQAVSRLADVQVMGVRPLRFIMPFTHIAGQITSMALLQRTPLGVLSQGIRDNLLGRNGPVARDMQVARMAVGSAVVGSAMWLGAQGLANGPGPTDPKEARVYRAVHGSPNSLRIGDWWYDVHRLGPMGLVFTTGAALQQLAHTMTDGETEKAVTSLVAGISQELLDESWLKGPSDAIRAITDWQQYGAEWVRGMVASAVPFSALSGQIERVSDPYVREARTIADAVRAKIPGLAKDLPVRYDLWGRPLPQRIGLGDGFTSIYAERAQNDPVEQTLDRLGREGFGYPAMPERNMLGVRLTDRQYDEYARMAGQMAKMRLDALVRTPGFSVQLPYVQAETIRSVFTGARAQAAAALKFQGMLEGGDADIVGKSIANKKALLAR